MKLKTLGILLLGFTWCQSIFAQVTISISSDIVCYGGAITLSASQFPDSTICMWQKSTNAVDFTDITNSTNLQSYTLNIFQPHTFRLKIVSGIHTYYSVNTVSVAVYAPIQAATISGADTICYGTIPNVLTITTPPSGSSNIHNRWQKSSNGLQWEDIGAVDQLSFQPEALTISTKYRVKTYSLTCQDVAYSNILNVGVLPEMNVSVSSDTAICCNERALLRVSATGAGNNYTYQWQKSTDNNLYIDLAGQENTTLLTDNLVSGQYYRCVVLSSSCLVSETTNSCHINVYPLLQAPVIGYSGTDTLCYQTAPTSAFTTISAPQGSDGSYTYQWEKRQSGGSWSAISGATQSNYQSGILYTTTSFRLKIMSLCGTTYSNIITVTVRPSITAPQISYSGTTICYRSTPSPLAICTYATDNFGGTFSYQWQKFQNNSYTNIVGEYGDSLQPGILYVSTKYRVKATSLQGCGTSYSNVQQISVWDSLQVNIHADTTICYNTPILLSVDATGAGNNYAYQWYESLNGTSFNSIGGATGDTYQSGDLTSDKYYRCKVTPVVGCTAKFTTTTHIDVYQDLNSAVISNMGLDTICYNTAPGQLSTSAYPTGADGMYEFQWEKRVDEGNWETIIGANQSHYVPNILQSTSSFRLKTTAPLCGRSEYSNIVTIYVRSPLSPAVLYYSNDTICYNHQPSAIHITNPASDGFDGAFSYQWYANGQVIENEQGFVYQPPMLTQSTSFNVSAVSLSGCGIVYSNPIIVNVWPDLSVEISNDTSICYNSAGVLSVHASGSGSFYTFQWQISNGDSSYSDIPGATSNILLTNSLTSNRYYKCLVMPLAQCPNKYSPISLVSVYSELQPATIVGADTICYNTIPSQLSISQYPIGSDGNYLYQWQKQGMNNIWSTITGATNPIYIPQALDTTTTFRLVASSLCGEVYSNPITIVVRRPLTPAEIAYQGDTICYGTIPTYLETISAPSDGLQGQFTYQWLESVDNTNFVTIPNATNTRYYPDTLNSSRYYKLKNESIYGCGSVYSNMDKINVWDDLSISIVSDTAICYATKASFYVLPTGSGDVYTYQWFESTDSTTLGTPVSGAIAQSYLTDTLIQNRYYRCEVIPVRGCETKSSDYVSVLVGPELLSGIITAPTEVCFNEEWSTYLQTPTTGGVGNYQYQWQISWNNSLWHDIDSANMVLYTKNADSSSYFRLIQYDFCGTVVSNAVFVFVNPLPPLQSIQGEDIVCANQFEWYKIDHLNNGFTYSWNVDGNGAIVTEPDNVDSIEVHWNDVDAVGNVELEITNNQTACKSANYHTVQTNSNYAPDKTPIVRKPNSNILVAQTDLNGFYEWGYTHRATKENHIIECSDRRYVLLPMPFDYETYDYWLRLRDDKSSTCYSLSYYKPENDTLIEPKIESPVILSQKSSHQLTISINNENGDDVHIAIYTVSGQLIYSKYRNRSQYVSEEVTLDTGVYVLQVTIGSKLYYKKTVVR